MRQLPTLVQLFSSLLDSQHVSLLVAPPFLQIIHLLLRALLHSSRLLLPLNLPPLNPSNRTLYWSGPWMPREKKPLGGNTLPRWPAFPASILLMALGDAGLAKSAIMSIAGQMVLWNPAPVPNPATAVTFHRTDPKMTSST